VRLGGLVGDGDLVLVTAPGERERPAARAGHVDIRGADRNRAISREAGSVQRGMNVESTQRTGPIMGADRCVWVAYPENLVPMSGLRLWSVEEVAEDHTDYVTAYSCNVGNGSLGSAEARPGPLRKRASLHCVGARQRLRRRHGRGRNRVFGSLTSAGGEHRGKY
jgi:hypothetical protein